MNKNNELLKHQFSQLNREYSHLNFNYIAMFLIYIFILIIIFFVIAFSGSLIFKVNGLARIFSITFFYVGILAFTLLNDYMKIEYDKNKIKTDIIKKKIKDL